VRKEKAQMFSFGQPTLFFLQKKRAEQLGRMRAWGNLFFEKEKLCQKKAKRKGSGMRVVRSSNLRNPIFI